MRKKHPTPPAQRAPTNRDLQRSIYCCSAVLLATGVLWHSAAPEMLKFRLTAISSSFVLLTFTAAALVRALRKTAD
jgi:hypothetical protein